jgi:arylsulfatase A-like enzyme
MKLKRHIMILLCATVLVAAAGFSRAAETTRPNFLFILADDLGWPDVSCYGQQGWRTPNIDRLAGEGMRFTSAYADSPVCSPTRASILTGKHPQRIGMTGILEMAGGNYKVPDNAVVLPAPTRRDLPAGEVTVAAALREGGYTTCLVGKWHVGRHPKDCGFDAWPCFTAGNKQPRFVDGQFFTEVQATAAVKWLREKRDRPFFLFFSTHAVHAPLAANQVYLAECLRQGLPASGPWNATYAAYVRHLDDTVGRLLDEIDAQKLTRNTVVIFFSDNGGRGLDVSRNTPWRGAKGQLYEGGIRVPLIVRWPGVVPAGRTCDEPAISTDFYSTLLEMAGLPLRPDQHCDGASLLPLLKGQPKSHRDALFWHHPHYSTVGVPHSAIRAGDWKLIQYYSGYRREWDERKGALVEYHAPSQVELFDLGRDPSERENVAAKEPAKVEVLERKLRAHLTQCNAHLPPLNPAHDPRKPETGLFKP